MAREPNDPSSVPGIDSSATPTSMLTRSTLRRPDRPDQDESPKPKGQTRPIEERFLLKVDGQLKRSFGSGEAAKTAGSTIDLSIYFPSTPSFQEDGARRGCVVVTANPTLGAILDDIVLLRRWN